MKLYYGFLFEIINYLKSISIIAKAYFAAALVQSNCKWIVLRSRDVQEARCLFHDHLFL